MDGNAGAAIAALLWNMLVFASTAFAIVFGCWIALPLIDMMCGTGLTARAKGWLDERRRKKEETREDPNFTDA